MNGAQLLRLVERGGSGPYNLGSTSRPLSRTPSSARPSGGRWEGPLSCISRPFLLRPLRRNVHHVPTGGGAMPCRLLVKGFPFHFQMLHVALADLYK